MKRVNISEDLAIAIGDRSVRISPGEAFRLAETLIRRVTVRMIAEEADRVAGTDSPGRVGLD